MIDLHTHSTFSDGALSPQALLTLAAECGLKALALTDHDTVGGVLSLGRPAALRELVPGIEISIQHNAGRRFHLLGLFIRPDHPEAAAYERTMAEKRHERNRAILDKLKALGHPLAYEDVCALGRGIVGRMHIALAMAAKGYVAQPQDAFPLFLNAGCPAYLPRFRLVAEDGIAFVHRIGGLAVLAHIGKELAEPEQMREALVRLKECGLDGLEVFHSDHSAEVSNHLLGLARELDLGVSGGSDFHGANKPDVTLGTGRGDMNIPFSVYEALKERWERTVRG